MNDELLSKIITLSLKTDLPSDVPQPKEPQTPSTLPADSILPSFLLKDYQDDQAAVNDSTTNNDGDMDFEGSELSQDNNTQPPSQHVIKKQLAPPNRRQLCAPLNHKFCSLDNTAQLSRQVILDTANTFSNAYGMNYNNPQNHLQQGQALYAPTRTQLSMNNFSNSFQNFNMAYNIQPTQQPQTNTFMYNTPAFNYTQQPQTFTNIATTTTTQPPVSTLPSSVPTQLHHPVHQPQMPQQRINSFNIMDNNNNTSIPIRQILHSPTKNHNHNQSQNSFPLSRGYLVGLNPQFANHSNNPTDTVTSTNANATSSSTSSTTNNVNSTTLNLKKVSNSISSSKKNKKKVQKKSTTDSDSLSISNLLKLPETELYSFIITQKGSRKVQNILKKVTENEVDLLISKLSPHFSDIMIDKYGNYFSQRLIQICSPNQRVEILKSIKTRFTEIAINSFGTHPLQSLIEIVNMPKEREILLHCIEGNELELSLDSKGTHVIQKFILCSTENERNNVDMNILNHLPKLINDSFGVCVLIKLIKHTNNKLIKETIAKYISDNNALSFIQNPYANYVVQSLFNQNDIYLCNEIINTIVDHFFSLSMQKFSSNVVENCIRYSEEKYVKKIYKDILSTGKLGSMLNNTYGNFVIEKLIGRLTREEKGEMIKEITKIGKEKNLSNTIMNLLYK